MIPPEIIAIQIKDNLKLLDINEFPEVWFIDTYEEKIKLFIPNGTEWESPSFFDLEKLLARDEDKIYYLELKNVDSRYSSSTFIFNIKEVFNCEKRN